MKRFKIVLLLVLTALMAVSCTKERVSYLPDGHWLIHVDGATEGHRLGLTFHGNEMEVRDAGWLGDGPFSNGWWNYYITDDNEFCMWQSTTDSDGDTYTESYSLGYGLNENQTQLTLIYEPFLGSRKTYVFDRR